MNWYLTVLKKYAEFSGRSRRKEYWLFVLFNMIFAFGLLFIDSLIGTFDPEIGIGLLYSIYCLGVMIPAIAVMVRRLHDTNRSGWWFFIILIPFIGGIVLLVFLATDSTPGENQYGANPKGM